MQKKGLVFAALLPLFLFGFVKNSNAQTQPVSTCVATPSSACACISKGFYRCDPKKYTDCDNSNMQSVKPEMCDQPVSNSPNSTPGGGIVGAFIPKCAFDVKYDPTSDCSDVTIFLILMYNVINYLFGIIGGVALLFFVYGGFVLILSQGNTEKISQGKSIILSAVLGIIIAFSGYAIVSFVGDVLQVNKDYALISK